MRIAYICADPGIPVFGTKGASVHIQEVARALRRAGHRVDVYTARRGTVVPPDLADLPVHELPVPAAQAAQREQLQSETADWLAHMVAAAAPDLVYERYSLFSTALAQITAVTRAPGVLEVNAPLIEEQRQHRVLVDEERAWECLREQAQAAQLVVCVSEPVRRWVAREVPEARTLVVPNGVDPVRVSPSPEDPAGVTVVFVGTLKPWHGVEDLLQATALARAPWRLRVVGDGPERERLRTLARELGIDVEFTGAVPPLEVPTYLAGTAIAVAPYPNLGSEAAQYFSPLKVLEYMAAGLPVVASKVGQVPQLLGDAGVLVTPSAPAELAAAIDQLALEPERRTHLGALARHLAVTRYSWDQVVRQVLEATEASHAQG